MDCHGQSADGSGAGGPGGPPCSRRLAVAALGFWWLGWTAVPCGAAEEPARRPAARELKVGDVFPDLKEFPLAGKPVASLKGKVAVVDFWASWCAPCQRTFPVMEDMHLHFSRLGLVIVAINVDKSRVAMEEFLKEHPVTFDVVRDAKRELVSRIRLPSLPATFVLDRQGRVRSICNGFKSPGTKREHMKLIEELLKEPVPPAPPP